MRLMLWQRDCFVLGSPEDSHSPPAGSILSKGGEAMGRRDRFHPTEIPVTVFFDRRLETTCDGKDNEFA